MAVALSILLSFTILPIVNAQMGGPGSGPGMDDNGERPGPRWDQDTNDETLRKGLMFRYGQSSPATSVEGENTGSDISLKVSSLSFTNETSNLTIDLEEEEWTLIRSEEGENIRITYTKMAQWEENDSPTGQSSQLEVEYVYRKDIGSDFIDFDLEVLDLPGNGDLSVGIKISTYQSKETCCWSGNGALKQDLSTREITLKNSDGTDLSKLRIEQSTILDNTTEPIEVETYVSGNLENESAVVDIGLALPEDPQMASFTGSLEIFEELINALSEGAEEVKEFVMDHIYSFIMGAVVVAVILTAAFMTVSKKQKETQGKDLDLTGNRYYKGPQ